MSEELSRRHEVSPSEGKIDVDTARRFTRAFGDRINLTTIDLPREMGFDPKLVSVQQIIYLAEQRGLTPRLYQALGITDPSELIPAMCNLPKDGPVGKRLGGIAGKIGLTFEDLIDSKSHAQAFLSMINTPEAIEKLKQALTKMGY